MSRATATVTPLRKDIGTAPGLRAPLAVPLTLSERVSRIVQHLVDAGAFVAARAAAFPIPETEEAIIPRLIDEGIDAVALANAVGARALLHELAVYNRENSGEPIARKDDWLLGADGVLYFVNPLHGDRVEKIFREMKPKAPGKTIVNIGVLPYTDAEHGVLAGSDNRITDEEADQLIKSVVDYGLTVDASDVHIEPQTNEATVRYRIDGRLTTPAQPVRIPFGAKYKAFSNRLLTLANGDPGVYNIPFDGRFSWRMANRPIYVRLAMSPTRNGGDTLPRFVLRYLGVNTFLADFDQVGFSANHAKQIKRELHRAHGLILVTGPTGSGKTTTLYALLRFIQSHSPHKSINTLEDPVEIEVKGFNQVEINEDAGLTWADGLKSFLRSDPDVILIGETRDRATAEEVLRASQTGHLVFSTLHTNNAPDTILRLLDLGVNAQILADTLKMVTAQRLVRAVCPRCSQLVRFESEERLFRLYGKYEGAPAPQEAIRIAAPEGCNECKGQGFRGRRTINEIMFVTPGLAKLIAERRPMWELRKELKAQGHKTLWHDGLRLVREGQTTLTEVEDVLGPYDAD